jgi:hypothetical protein
LERAKVTYWPLALKWGKKNKKSLAYAGFLLCLAIGLIILQSTLGSNASRDANDWDSTADSIKTPGLDNGDIDGFYDPPSYEDEEQQEDTPNDETVESDDNHDTVESDEEKAPEKNESEPEESVAGKEEEHANDESDKPSLTVPEEKNGTAPKKNGTTPIQEEHEEPKAEVENVPWDSVRLPPWQVPTHYDLDR